MVKRIFEKFKRSFGTDEPDIDEVEDEYVELDVLGGSEDKKGTAKVIVRPFVINDFSDIKLVLDSLRIGNTVGLINIKPLKNKDLVDKRNFKFMSNLISQSLQTKIYYFSKDVYEKDKRLALNY